MFRWESLSTSWALISLSRLCVLFQVTWQKENNFLNFLEQTPIQSPKPFKTSFSWKQNLNIANKIKYRTVSPSVHIGYWERQHTFLGPGGPSHVSQVGPWERCLQSNYSYKSCSLSYFGVCYWLATSIVILAYPQSWAEYFNGLFTKSKRFFWSKNWQKLIH